MTKAAVVVNKTAVNGGQKGMRKRIPYIAAFVWMFIITALAFADGLTWRNERMVSSCHDGCVAGNAVYLTENIDKDGILYVSDTKGNVKNVWRSSSLEPGSIFGKIDYKDGLFAVLVSAGISGDGTATDYRILQFDEQAQPVASSPVLHMAKDGVLTGFRAEEDGFYLTLVLEGGTEAGIYFVEKDRLADLSLDDTREEEPETLEVKLYQLVSCEEGRLFVEARFEDGKLLVRKDDKTGVEDFERPEAVNRAFLNRKLTAGQLMKLRQQRFVLYIQLLILGYVVLLLAFLILRNRNHTAYTIAIVEAVLLAITAAGAVQIPRVQEKAKEQEAERFGFYYVQALAEEIGSPVNLGIEEEDFYDSREYYALRNRLSGFVNLDGISEIFTDICVVRSSDHMVLASASGFNGQRFEEIYVAGTRKLLDALTEGKKASMVIRIDGEAYQVLGTAASEGLYPEYLLMGITRREDLSGAARDNSKGYLIYAQIIFLIGTIVSISLLVLQGRELKRLSKAMEAVAEGQMEVVKKGVHGKDVDFMWNSLFEIRKTISRINYTKYRIFESCYRFAPKNIEKILGKDSITEVKGGDMVLLHGTVAVISSTEPGDTNRRSADVMNRFIALIEKHKEEGGGFFVSGHSDLTLLKVLFLEESRNTLDFGTGFMQEFYEEKVLEGLCTGMFLHYAQYVYGVAGTDKQSFPFLLSREIKEIEQYARWFQRMGLNLVLTENVKNREAYDGDLRYIGYILITDTGERLRIYEALDACPLSQRRLKTETDGKFQKALGLFYQHDFYLARSTFSDVLKENPEDAMAKWYLFTCESYLNQVHMEGDICRLHWEQ